VMLLPCVLLAGCMSERLAEKLQVQREHEAIVAWRECFRPPRHYIVKRERSRRLYKKADPARSEQ
jgi:hypothetical protein